MSVHPGISNSSTEHHLPAFHDVTEHPRGTALSLAALRYAMGFTFLWPFFDKLFGLGYSTASAKSWINGGSPTKGFLGNLDHGPFQTMFKNLAGLTVIDWLFMLALLGIGVAVILGVAMRIAAVSGTILLVMMWAAEWPLARFTNTGDPTRSTNPFLDDHLIFALVLIVLAATGAGMYYGLGKWWRSLTLVQHNPWLR